VPLLKTLHSAQQADGGGQLDGADIR